LKSCILQVTSPQYLALDPTCVRCDQRSPPHCSHHSVIARRRSRCGRAWNAVASWLGEGIAAHEIGLFVRTPQLVVRARAAIDGLAGAAEMVTAQMSLAKGLEFRAVVVMACDEGVLPLDERIADAADEAELDIYETERAREHLLLTGVTPVSEYLADLIQTK
jgi:hypothetical protein